MLITPEALARDLNRDDWVVVDCRFNLTDPDGGRKAYELGHVPGAVYAHLDDDLASPITPVSGRHPLPEPADFAARLGCWGIDDRTRIIAYDDADGAVAARLWWLLRWLGHSEVAVLEGGYRGWLAIEGPVSRDVPDAGTTRFQWREQPGFWVNVDEVSSVLDESGRLLVDARDRKRFSGEEEPLDAVAGHIPGAVNRPYTENLAPDGRFKAPRLLQHEYTELLTQHGAHELICMCGSGVTACHNLLAMESAGLAGGKLYPGSWSEWIRDPERPVATDTRWIQGASKS